VADDGSRCLDSPPFELLIPALDKRQQGVDDLPRGKAAYLRKGLVQIALIQKIEKLFLETATAILQCKDPSARERNRKKILTAKLPVRNHKVA